MRNEKRQNHSFRNSLRVFLILSFFLGLFFILNLPRTVQYNKEALASAEAPNLKPKITHIKTPEPLKAIYMTACIASLSKERENIAKLIDETELNSVVIDIKDYTGVVSFKTDNASIDSVSETGKGCRVGDLKEFIENLHERDIYVIGRVAVFQDPLYTKLHPELAVKSKSSGGVWKDRKGLSFIDVGAKPFWDYILSIATSSYAIGFDEINFDYIRFPSDGNMEDADYTYDRGLSKREAVRKFWEYLSSNLSGSGMKTSADIFGMTTTNSDDLGIGQVLEYALENFDYVAPMVYPSHYPPNFNGWPDPNKVPYEIVKFAMSSAVSRINFLYKEVSATSTISIVAGQATSTPKVPDAFLMNRVKPGQLRPWLQDNDYPVHYTAAMIRAQIQATYDAGLTSWMLWDPANTYTREALLSE